VQNNVDVTDAEAVIRMMDGLKWEFFLQGKAVTFKIDGTQPGADLRSEPVRERVSDIAAIPEIRTVIVDQLRDMVQFGSLAMEGRDIGTVVFPATPYKYYIDADPEVRARRRHKDLIASKEQCDVDRVLDSLKRRDHKDTSRATAPLQIALGATVVDSTDMSIDEVVAFIVNDVQRGKKAGSRG
jgi:cytidylate kinase